MLFQNFVIFINFFFSFGHTHNMQKFLGRGSNLHYSSDNTGSLTHWPQQNSPKVLFYLIKNNFFCVFLGPHPQNMEAPRLGGSKWSCSFWLTPQSQERQIWATSETHTTAHGNTRSLTHWMRPGIELASSWILVRSISAEPRWKLLSNNFK